MLKVLLPVVILLFFLLVTVIRPTTRRKLEAAALSDTGEARKKFGDDVKAISSDMFFGKQDNSEVYKHNVDIHSKLCFSFDFIW